MSDQDVIAGTADEVNEDMAPSARDLVPVAQTLAVTPSVNADELVARLDVIREAQEKAMVKDVDFGVIPGTDKPTLYKPGAEKLGVLFQLDIQLENEKTWGPGDHLTVMSHATVYHAPTGSRLGYGEGVCTTRERKYAKRRLERACPACGKAAVIKGKAEYGGGWLCWKKRDGCGAKYQDGDPDIENQEAGEVENPDLPDLWNTVVKMAEKRARVDAVLAVTGASALFTQDAEDMAPPDPPAPSAEDQGVEPGEVAMASPSQRRLIYERASGRLSGRELYEILVTAKGRPTEDLTEREAITRIDDEIRTLPAAAVDAVLRKVPQ